jgi:membrane protein implicated in regulation of membrane protease activity
MMFGLVGLALRIDSGTGVLLSLVGAAVAGGFSVWLISRIFKLFSRLQSSGTLDMWQAMGATGTVYLTVAKEKPGKVQINIADRFMTVDAVTDSPEPLVTGSRIRVINVVQENIVVVEPE